MRVAALFTRERSHYAELGADCFPRSRGAHSFDLASPVVAHPPCRAWGRLRQFAKPREGERDLAIWAMWVVRHCGGVLEHPMCSQLWSFFGLVPGRRDTFGGLLVPVDQSAFGHSAPKRTGLYFVRCELAVLPLAWGQPVPGRVSHMCTAQRERTPIDLASALLNAARSAA
jgi:hypothetical protein